MVSIEHVRSHTGVRGNEARADALAKRGTQIGDRERVVELRSAEPPYETREHLVRQWLQHFQHFQLA